MENSQGLTGFLLLCGCSTSLLLAGGFLGYRLALRVVKLGWKRCFIPGFVIRWVERME